MTTGHTEGTQCRPPRRAAALLKLSFAQWLCDPGNHRLLDGVTDQSDMASLFRDSEAILYSACESDKERAVVVSRPCPASSVFAHANTGGVPA